MGPMCSINGQEVIFFLDASVPDNVSRCCFVSLLCLSPSGCTFWGKKPWSQTRKIMWQVGMLLGAPVVISLIAGIAIPVIIVGIPIYMGRKVRNSCNKLLASRGTRSSFLELVCVSAFSKADSLPFVNWQKHPLIMHVVLKNSNDTCSLYNL